jgi:hypothetical protein
MVKRYAIVTDNESTARAPKAHVSPRMGKSTAVPHNPVLTAVFDPLEANALVIETLKARTNITKLA